MKSLKFNKKEDRTIFDLNKNKSLVEYPELLLQFDENATSRIRQSTLMNILASLSGTKAG